MGLFQLFTGWRDAILNKPLDAMMRQTADVGLSTYLAHVHRITGYLASSAGTEYRQGDKTVMLHIDASYALIEAGRGGSHDAITPACRAMGQVWGGNFEVHLPNVTQRGIRGEARNRARVGKLQAALGRAGRKTTFHVRRWHKRLDPIVPHDPTTPLL